MLTDYDLLQYAFENDLDFRNSIIESSESDLLDFEKSSSSTMFDDGTTDNESLSELDENIEESETQTIVVYDTTDYSPYLNGLLTNTYFIVYFLFAFFIVGALILVIKFIRSFF